MRQAEIILESEKFLLLRTVAECRGVEIFLYKLFHIATAVELFFGVGTVVFQHG